MAIPDSSLGPRKLVRARALLAEPIRNESLIPVAAAATFFALSALALAMTLISMPPHWSN
jgi:hypothetical protein